MGVVGTDQEECWHVWRDGKQYGPYPFSVPIEAVRKSILETDAQVWRTGWDSWGFLATSPFGAGTIHSHFIGFLCFSPVPMKSQFALCPPPSAASSRFCVRPRAIAVYASRPLSPVVTQHSLPSGRYPLLGPDLHRLDRTSFAWRTYSITSISAGEQRGWHGEAERLGGLQVDGHVILGRLHSELSRATICRPWRSVAPRRNPLPALSIADLS
jgi:hypothetical protein